MGIRKVQNLLKHEDFKKYLRFYLREYHKLFPRMVPKGEISEHINVNVLETLKQLHGLDTDILWSPNSQRRGTDVELFDCNLSLKTGMIKTPRQYDEEVLRYSSYRTYGQKTLEDKKKFLTEQKEDVGMYWFLTNQTHDDGFSYRMFVWNGKQLNYETLEEEGDGNYRWWGDGLDVFIQKSLGDQEWVQVALRHLTEIDHFKVDLGSSEIVDLNTGKEDETLKNMQHLTEIDVARIIS
jgi:hypothetical protein